MFTILTPEITFLLCYFESGVFVVREIALVTIKATIRRQTAQKDNEQKLLFSLKMTLS